jgi:hypothetical protein
MFNASLVGDRELVARFDMLPDNVQAALEAKVTALALKLQRHIVTEKLHGQVLGQRSGDLARSIQEEAPIREGTGIFGRVFSAGDVKYARFWEEGFHGVEQVRQHIRTMIFGREVDPFSVGPFERRVDQDARPFMKSSLAEMAEEITTGLKQAVVEGMRKR